MAEFNFKSFYNIYKEALLDDNQTQAVSSLFAPIFENRKFPNNPRNKADMEYLVIDSKRASEWVGDNNRSVRHDVAKAAQEAAIVGSIVKHFEDVIVPQELSDYKLDSMVSDLLALLLRLNGTRKDWKKECMAEITEQTGSFRKKDDFGECLFVMQYPKELTADVVGRLKEIGCDMYISTEFDGIAMADQIDFGRTLEQRFNKHGLNANEFINASMMIMFSCDSDDARAIIEKTILSILSAVGFIIAPCVGAQKKAAEAAISFGLLNLTYVRNVRVDLADQIKLFGGHEDGSD